MPPNVPGAHGEAGSEEYPSTPPLPDQNPTSAVLEAEPYDRQLLHGETLEEHVCQPSVTHAAPARPEDVTSTTAFPPAMDERIESERSPEEPLPSNLPGPAGKKTTGKATKRSRLPKRAVTTYATVSRLQDRLLMDQTKLTHARDTMGFTLDTLKESLSYFMSISESIEQQQASPELALTSARKDAYHQLLSSVQNFETDLQEVAQLEESLGRSAYRLRDLQPKLLKSIDDRFEIPTDDFKRAAESPPSNHRAASVSDEDPLEHEYYDKRGDVRLLKEQLFNLQHGIQRLLDEEDDVAPASLSLEEEAVVQQEHDSSLEQRRMKYESMKQLLQQEEKELKRLWKECKKAGLDVGSLSKEITWPFDAQNQPPPSPPRDTPRIELDESPTNYFTNPFQNFHWPQISDIPVLGEKWNMIEEWVLKPSGIDAIFAQAGPSFGKEIERRPSTPKSDSEWVAVGKFSNGFFEPDEIVTITAEPSVAGALQASNSKQATKLLRVSKSDELLAKSFKQQNRSPRHSAANVGLRE